MVITEKLTKMINKLYDELDSLEKKKLISQTEWHDLNRQVSHLYGMVNDVEKSK